MAFEWDEDNRKAHLAKHGVDFRRATQIFDGPTVETVDDRVNYRETRINALGEIEGRVYAVAYTWRGPSRRIISARKKPMRENKENTTRVTSDEARRLKDETEYARLDAMTDDAIAKAVASDPGRRAARMSTGTRPTSSFRPARTWSPCASTATSSTGSAPRAKAGRPSSTRSCEPSMTPGSSY